MYIEDEVAAPKRIHKSGKIKRKCIECGNEATKRLAYGRNGKKCDHYCDRCNKNVRQYLTK